VTVSLSQTVPGKQIQVDTISSPSAEIPIDLDETPSTSNCHEGSSTTNKQVRNLNSSVMLG
jgi:hypothetical protein